MSKKKMERNQNRSGQTKISSISMSDEFADIVNQYNLSPTECFRKGVAVSLYDMGISKYDTETNEKRSKYVQEVLSKFNAKDEIKKIEKLIQDLNKIVEGLKDEK